MKIKICGIRSEADINLINRYKPDFIGFIFYKKSKRYIQPEKVIEIKKNLEYQVKSVGVFVDEDSDYILDCFNKGVFDIAQLHGSEKPSECQRLHSEGLPVIKAIRIKNSDDIKISEVYNPDYFLFDVKSEKFVGGTGESFNWNLLENYHGNTPFFLAGGIGPENIIDAMKTNADILDISSSVETNFIKDNEKMRKLFNNYRKNNV